MPSRSLTRHSTFYSLLAAGLVALGVIISSPVIDQNSSSPSEFDLHLGAHLQSSIISGPMSSLYGNTVAWLAPFSTAVQSALKPATQWIHHKISRGDTLSRIWERYGASRQSAELAAQALNDLGDGASKLRHGEELEIEVLPDGEIGALKKKEKNGSVILLEGDSERGYSSQIIQPTVVESVHSASGIITSSFVSAALQQDIPYQIVDEYVDLFGGRVEFHRALQPGDTFTVEYVERRTADGELLDPGQIQSASIFTGGKLLAAIERNEGKTKPQYYDEEGNALGNYFLRYPVQFTRISSTFSDSRFHPVLKIYRPHLGVDFAAPQGTAVRTVADGVVEISGWTGGGGKTVKIKHSDRWSTAYMHLSKISPNLRTGVRVTRGEVIGAVGMTGLATAPHLHFALYDKAKYVNPLTTNLPQTPLGPPLPKDFLVAALQTMRDAHEQLQRVFVAQRTGTETRKKV